MIPIFIKMFGICIGCSVFRFYFRQNFITGGQLTKIVSAYLVLQMFSWMFFKNFYVHWLLFFAPVFSFILFFIFYLRWRESQFQYEFPDILTSLILQMKMGRGFRASLQKLAEQVPKKYAPTFLYVYENVVFSPHLNGKIMTVGSPFLRQIVAEFIKVDQISHKSIEKLENFRRRLIIVNNFRRRSGRIRGQVQLQAAILVFIYAICFAAVWFSFPLRELQGMLFLSFALFAAGLIFIFILGRDVKWKI